MKNRCGKSTQVRAKSERIINNFDKQQFTSQKVTYATVCLPIIFPPPVSTEISAAPISCSHLFRSEVTPTLSACARCNEYNSLSLTWLRSCCCVSAPALPPHPHPSTITSHSSQIPRVHLLHQPLASAAAALGLNREIYLTAAAAAADALSSEAEPCII